MPVLPPNATPEQRQVWAQQMQAWSRAQMPGDTPAESTSRWWNTYIGSPGSSKTQFDPQTGRVASPANSTPSLLNTNPITKPTTPVPQPASLGRGDINLKPEAPSFTGSTPPDMSSQVGNKIPGQAQGQNGIQLPTMGFETDPLHNMLPGATSGPEPAPTNLPDDPTAWSGGIFTGTSTVDQPDPSGLSGMLGKLNAQDWLGAAGLGLGAAGAFMNASTQKDQFNRQMAQQQSQFDANLHQVQATTGLNATQLDPYKQQNDLASSALRRVLLEKGPAQAGLGTPNTIDPGKADRAAVGSQFLNDNALGNAAANFETARHHADPTGTPNDLSKTGLGQAGVDANAQVAGANPSAMSQQALQSALLSGTNQQSAERDTGGGFWKTLARIGTIAAPIIAAPFTGGMSLAAIGALSGAANSALNGGGWKQDLLGAGLGAIPGLGTPGGLAENAAKPALTAGLKQAAVSTLKRPQTALAVAGALRK